MQLILLQKVVNLGNLGDKVEVKPGFGRNFLVPQGKAVPATEANLAQFEARRAEYEAKASTALAEAETRREALQDASVTIYANASTSACRWTMTSNSPVRRSAPSPITTSDFSTGLPAFVSASAISRGPIEPYSLPSVEALA